MFWWETTEIGVSTRVSAHETLDSIKEPTHTPDCRNKGPLGAVSHPKACLSFDINNIFMLKQSLESQQVDLRMFKKLRFRAERGPFTAPTRLKLIGFPLTGNDVCNQKSLSETASVSNLHSPLFLSLSSQSAQTPRMSSGITNTRWMWRPSAAARFTTSCSNRACLSPHSWEGSPLRSLVQISFFFFGQCERKTAASDGYSCQHHYPKLNCTTKHPNRGIMVHQVHHSPSSMTLKKQKPDLFYGRVKVLGVTFMLCSCTVSVCGLPGEGAAPGCAWEAAAAPPPLAYAGGSWGGLHEGKNGGREGGSAEANSGITTEISA